MISHRPPVPVHTILIATHTLAGLIADRNSFVDKHNFKWLTLAPSETHIVVQFHKLQAENNAILGVNPGMASMAVYGKSLTFHCHKLLDHPIWLVEAHHSGHSKPRPSWK